MLGIRHHGPGSARSVGQALDELEPDLVLIEGAPELDPVVDLLADPETEPPIAGLVYALDQPRRAAFYPLAEFSPEWVAARWALRHRVEVHFADLPAVHQLAMIEPEQDHDANRVRPDPIGMLARTAGYDDPERWWEDAIEQRGGSTLARFAAVREAMAAVRAEDRRPTDDPDVLDNARREAAMRKAIRAGVRAGHDRIAFVCGAYHSPALVPSTFPSVSHDTALLAKLPKIKIGVTWAPWTASRLAMASGYGAGVTSPGWYQHLFSHWSAPAPTDDVASSWLVRVARAIRAEDLDASTASVVEATRLAETLAALRGRPSVGLTELDDATQAVLCDGSRIPMALVHDSLVVGRTLGRVPRAAPIIPLAADLARQQRSLRLTPSPQVTTVTLDLRRDSQLARSVLFHRLRLLDIGWATEAAAGRSSGTFKEAWELDWQPELTVAVIDAGLYGTTVAAAAEARIAAVATTAADLATLSGLISQCLVADLPDALTSVVVVLEQRTAQRHDALALLGTIEPLARTVRYGSVRGVDTTAVAELLRAITVRAAVGLPPACGQLDDAGAAALRVVVDGADRGIGLLDDDALRTPWQTALATVAAADRAHGTLSGRANRLLLDAGRIDHAEAARRMSRRLSPGAPASAAAAWMDGFLAGEAVLLVHDPVLLGVVDDWVSQIGDETFADLLPLLRRTFAQFSAAERRTIGDRLGRAATGPGVTNGTDDHGPVSADDDLDLTRARPAIDLVARLLGLRSAS